MSGKGVSLSWEIYEVKQVDEKSLFYKKNVYCLLFIVLAQKFYEFLCGATTVANGILGFGTHLGKGQAACFYGSEDRVISKAAFTNWLH